MVPIAYLKPDENGIAVFGVPNGKRVSVRNVPENIVRCALGEEDMQYLLHTDTVEFAFNVTESEWKDFVKYSR